MSIRPSGDFKGVRNHCPIGGSLVCLFLLHEPCYYSHSRAGGKIDGDLAHPGCRQRNGIRTCIIKKAREKEMITFLICI